MSVYMLRAVRSPGCTYNIVLWRDLIHVCKGKKVECQREGLPG